MFIFQDRKEAGNRLADIMTHYSGLDNVIVLALPRGGVAVASEVAKKLKTTMDILLVRKISLKTNKEIEIATVTSSGYFIRNEELIRQHQISEELLEETISQEISQLRQKEDFYRKGISSSDLHKKVVILVDDGVATGSTLRAAIDSIKKQKPERLVVAVPVVSQENCADLLKSVNSVITLLQPTEFFPVSNWYVDFEQLSDEEIHNLLTETANNNFSLAEF